MSEEQPKVSVGAPEAREWFVDRLVNGSSEFVVSPRLEPHRQAGGIPFVVTDAYMSPRTQDIRMLLWFLCKTDT
jgi:hypothetical protein